MPLPYSDTLSISRVIFGCSFFSKLPKSLKFLKLLNYLGHDGDCGDGLGDDAS